MSFGPELPSAVPPTFLAPAAVAAAALAWSTYAYADAVDEDGKTICPGGFSANATHTGFSDVTLVSGVNASAVGSMAYIEWTLKDAHAAALADVSEIELISAIVQFIGDKLPDGARIGIAFTVGGMGATTKGIAAGIQGTSNGVVPWHSGFAASWSAVATGGAADKASTTGQLQVLRGNSLTQVRLSSSIRQVDGYQSKQAATTSPLTSTAGGRYDRIALVVGNTAALGASEDITAGIKSVLQNLAAISGMPRQTRAAPQPRHPSEGSYGVVFNGHSMAASTVVGSQAGTTVNAGWQYFNTDGLEDATWDALSSPGHSLSAALLDGLSAISGNTGGYIARRASSGAQLAATSVADQHFGDSIYDVADNSLDHPDAVILWYGANDANSTEEQANDYLPALRRHIEQIRERWPNCAIFLPSEHTTAGYAYLATIEAAKDTVAGEYDHVYHVTYDYQTAGQSADAIHPDAAGYEAIGLGLAAYIAALTF